MKIEHVPRKIFFTIAGILTGFAALFLFNEASDDKVSATIVRPSKTITAKTLRNSDKPFRPVAVVSGAPATHNPVSVDTGIGIVETAPITADIAQAKDDAKPKGYPWRFPPEPDDSLTDRHLKAALQQIGPDLSDLPEATAGEYIRILESHYDITIIADPDFLDLKFKLGMDIPVNEQPLESILNGLMARICAYGGNGSRSVPGSMFNVCWTLRDGSIHIEKVFVKKT